MAFGTTKIESAPYEEFGEFVYRARIDLLSRQSLLSALATVLAVGIFVALTRSYIKTGFLEMFTAGMATVAVLRIGFALHVKSVLAAGQKTKKLGRWHKVELLLVSLTGIGWATGAWFGLRGQEPESQLYLVVLLLGVSSLVALGYALFLEVFALISIPIIIVIMVVLFERFVLFGDSRPLTLAIGMSVYGGLLVSYSRRYQKVANDLYSALATLRRLNESLSRERESLVAARELAENSARSDPLTKLPNRLSLELETERWIVESAKQGSAFLVGFLDLSRFKAVNDRFGHHAGDLVIIRTAGLLRNTIREHDFAARVGGDEFVVLLKADPGQFSHIQDRLQSRMASFVIEELDGLEVNANVGFARYPDDGENLDQLLRIADGRMYTEKFGKTFPPFRVVPIGAANKV